ncbi:general secretion pathway protein GspK [Pseudomonas sp. GD03858]|uniref:type II secretion system protein GspK n=1 Tax=unclassified Pseudomonas TaxID=196821 RepID=UPI0024495004|nr:MULTISPECIES: type II secretion system protein GspK [unclassified Pseudomonas]MDH0648604.1 general secretion pathway protein GspK [Pseudomonas sp. GD03867]MDH0664611.1 general secretion pathway protein GspK [Pseudomonas sp. GD03858]
MRGRMPRHQQGLALILVLWLLAVLGLAMAGVVSTVRQENRQSHELLQRSKALSAAQGGVALAIHGVLKDPLAASFDGRVVQATLDGVGLSLSVRSEHGKLDLNFARLEHVERLFRQMGASPASARSWIEQMQKQRDAGKPLRHLPDLLSTTTVDPELYRRMLPYVTLWGGDGVPQAAYADPALIEALRLPSTQVLANNPGSVLSIEVVAVTPDGVTATLRTTVQLTPEDSEASVFRTLWWQES